MWMLDSAWEKRWVRRLAVVIGLGMAVSACSALGEWGRGGSVEPPRDPLTPLAAPIIPVEQDELPPLEGVEERVVVADGVGDAAQPSGGLGFTEDTPVLTGFVDPTTGTFVPDGLATFLAAQQAQMEAEAGAPTETSEPAEAGTESPVTPPQEAE